MSDSSHTELLAKARSGDTDALGCLLDMYRNSLYLRARMLLGSRLSTRVDHSDIVQETCLEVQRDFSGFRGECAEEWEGWINRILENNVAEAIRRHDQVQKRSVRTEKPLDDSHSPGGSLKNRLTGDEATPSRKAIQAEETVSLNVAIESMRPDQREVIRLRYLEGFTVKELAEHFGRSEMAVASLLYRAVEQLRRQLASGRQDQDL